MAETKRIGRFRRALSAAGGALLVLLLIAAVYVAAVLIQSPGENQISSFSVQEEKETVSRMQSATMNDAEALVQLFGAPLPVLPGFSFTGEAINAAHDGQNARVVTLRYEGVTLAAVRPASAAPLLQRSGLSVQMRRDLTVLGLPAVLAEKGTAHCLYFSSDSAAYALYAPNAGTEDFLSLTGKIAWVQ